MIKIQRSMASGFAGLAMVFGLVAGGGSARADLLSDFKKANGFEEGCETIPYSSRRSSCAGLGSQMNTTCKTTAFSCDNLKTQGLRKTIKEIEVVIEKMKKDKKPASEIANKQKILDGLEADLARKLAAIEPALERAQSCVNARKSISTIFDGTRDLVLRETDAAIKPIAAELAKKYVKVEADHGKAREYAANALETCKRAQAGTY